jgi:hypothetical protein
MVDRPQTPVKAVAKWLREVRIADIEEELVEIAEDKLIPYTPIRGLQLRRKYEEISPTDTNFSDNTVFDAAELPPPSPQSPSPAINLGRIAYPETEASSISDDDNDNQVPAKVKSTGLLTPADTAVIEQQDDDCLSIYSQNPPSTAEAELCDKPTPFSISVPLPPSPTGEPQLIFLTSCLQCTLANLPCTRTLPSCSRCIRNGHGSMCLLHRKRTTAEVLDLHPTDVHYSTPVLLKTWDTDERVWEAKLRLSDRLVTEWREGLEVENWVLPSVESVRGCWAKDGAQVPRVHPGPGLGRTTWRMVRLAED